MTQQKFKSYVHAVKPQLVIIGAVIILQILSLLAVIPPPGEIVTFMIKLLTTHGSPVVAGASFIENLAGIGTYFPGSIAIISAMALTAGHPGQALLIYFAIIIPAIAANILSYYIGCVSSNKQALTHRRSNKTMLAWYGATYWHPQLAAVSAMLSGSEGIGFWRYIRYALPISITWSVLWAVLLYNVGGVVSNRNFFAPLFYCYLAIWLLWGIKKHHRISASNN